MIDRDPVASVVVETDATPPLSVPVPIVVAPSLNVTEPLGVAPPAIPVTVAVKVTLCPWKEGFSEETTEVEELTLLTVCVICPLLLL